MTETSMADIWAMVDPEGTKKALASHRADFMQRLANAKGALLINQSNPNIPAAEKRVMVQALEKEAWEIYGVIQRIDAKIEATEEPLTPEPNRAARRRK